MKQLAIAVMGVGFLVIGLSIGYYRSSDAPARCEADRLQALQFAEQAVAVEGTPQAQELIDEAQARSEWADMECAHADAHRQTCLMIACGGVVLLAVGAVLAMRKRAPGQPSGV